MPEMIDSRKFIILALLSMMVLLGKSQTNLVFYNTTDQFHSSNFNPAFLVNQKQFTFSIFPLSGMSVGYNNQAVVKDMLKKIIRGDSITNTLNNVFNSLVKRGLFYQRFESSLLNFGYNSNLGSFNFRIKEIELLMSYLKGPFADFITDPTYNKLFINQPQTFPVSMVYYREYSLGYAREIIENKLNVGVRVKLYFGKFTALSEVQGQLVKEMNSAFSLQTKGLLKLSVPIIVSKDKDEVPKGGSTIANFTPVKFMLNSKNIGTGIDLGINYKINSQFILSASVVDLGKINWKNNLNTIKYKGKYEFPVKFTADPGSDYLTKIPNFSTEAKGRVNELFKADLSGESFSTPLPTNFYIGGQYQINSKFNIGIVDRYIKAKGMNFNSISVTGTFILKNNFTINTGYSILGNSYFNLPFGLIYNWDGGQYYIGTDNIFSFISSKSDYSGITFGTCFYLFQKKEKYKKQLEYLPFYKEKKVHPESKRGLVF